MEDQIHPDLLVQENSGPGLVGWGGLILGFAGLGFGIYNTLTSDKAAAKKAGREAAEEIAKAEVQKGLDEKVGPAVDAKFTEHRSLFTTELTAALKAQNEVLSQKIDDRSDDINTIKNRLDQLAKN